MTPRATDDGLNASDKFVLVKGFAEKIVGAHPEAFGLVFNAGEPRKYQDGSGDPRGAKRAQHLVSRNIWQVQVEQDDVVVIYLAEVYALLTEVSPIDVHALGLQHELDALRRPPIVLDEQDSHVR